MAQAPFQSQSQHDTEVLVVGAGPSGLVLALWLQALGAAVRIVDAASGPGTTSRALAVQARTLELYRQLDLTTAVLEGGYAVGAFNIWAEGEHRARIEPGAIGAGLTPYPFLYIFPQDRHERLLQARLADAGVQVERNGTLLGFDEAGDGILARLRHGDGREERCAARYIVGCDGARSAVRNIIGAGFPGGTYRQVFYVADIEGESPALNGELHLDLDESDVLEVFAMAPRGRARLVGTVRDERAEHAETLTFQDVSARAIDNLMITVSKVNWFSTYRVHHRVAERFRRARQFLFRTISQTVVHYRHAPLNEGSAGRVHGGDRLPWVAIDGGDNVEPLPRPGWQAHVYGTVQPEAANWCAAHHVHLRQYPWREQLRTVGLARDAFYLLRPDTDVALAAGTPDPLLFDRYLHANGLPL